VAAAISGDFSPGDLLDQDFFRQPLADAQAGIADLAYQARLAAEELDLLFFAETHFAQAMRHLRRGGKLFNAHVRPRPHTAERAQERLGTRLPSLILGMLRFVHPARLRQLAPAGKILLQLFFMQTLFHMGRLRGNQKGVKERKNNIKSRVSLDLLFGREFYRFFYGD
jgi:hypothetical protein